MYGAYDPPQLRFHRRLSPDASCQEENAYQLQHFSRRVALHRADATLVIKFTAVLMTTGVA